MIKAKKEELLERVNTAWYSLHNMRDALKVLNDYSNALDRMKLASIGSREQLLLHLDYYSGHLNLSYTVLYEGVERLFKALADIEQMILEEEVEDDDSV